MRVLIEHDFDCPLGVNGLRGYWEARDALSSTPPEARATPQDRESLAVAEFELQAHQVCRCGATEAQRMLALFGFAIRATGKRMAESASFGKAARHDT